MKPAEVILPLILVACYMVFTIYWMLRGYRRIEARIIQWLSNQIGGKKITKRISFRTENWQISGEHTRREGCFVTIVEMVTNLGCAAGPVFMALFLIVMILFAANGEF